MVRKNPAKIRGSLKATSIPKGKRKGEIFTKGGKRFMVISYTTSTGKRVRYAQAVSKCGSPAKKATCKVKITKRRKMRKNPFSSGNQRCEMPRSKRNWRAGYRYKDGEKLCVVQRTRDPNTYMGMAHTELVASPTDIAKKKKKGARFTANGVRYIVAIRKTAKGGYKRYAKKV